jgi:hypothetical protein
LRADFLEALATGCLDGKHTTADAFSDIKTDGGPRLRSLTDASYLERLPLAHWLPSQRVKITRQASAWKTPFDSLIVPL